MSVKKQTKNKVEDNKKETASINAMHEDFQKTLDSLPMMGTIKKMQSSLEILPCYSSHAQSIRLNHETPSSIQAYTDIKKIVNDLLITNEQLKLYEQSGVTYLTRVLINDFYKQLSYYLLPSQMVDKNHLGHICTAMQMNELEVIVWCYTIYILMTNNEIRDLPKVKFNNEGELVLATAILAKFATNDENEILSNKLISKLQLNRELIIDMFLEIKDLIDNPIAIDSFYLEMRLSNDPDMSRHAEDYNLMVIDMVKGSQQRGAPQLAGLGISNSFQAGQRNQQKGNEFNSSIGTELLGANRNNSNTEINMQGKQNGQQQNNQNIFEQKMQINHNSSNGPALNRFTLSTSQLTDLPDVGTLQQKRNDSQFSFGGLMNRGISMNMNIMNIAPQSYQNNDINGDQIN